MLTRRRRSTPFSPVYPPPRTHSLLLHPFCFSSLSYPFVALCFHSWLLWGKLRFMGQLFSFVFFSSSYISAQLIHFKIWSLISDLSAPVPTCPHLSPPVRTCPHVFVCPDWFWEQSESEVILRTERWAHSLLKKWWFVVLFICYFKWSFFQSFRCRVQWSRRVGGKVHVFFFLRWVCRSVVGDVRDSAGGFWRIHISRSIRNPAGLQRL